MDFLLEDKLKEIEFTENKENYILNYRDNYFSVSKLFYEILYELKNNYHDKYKFIKGHKISEDEYSEITQIISTKLDKITSEENKSQKKYIYLPIKIFKEDTAIFLSKHLKFFFEKRILKIFLPLTFIISILLYFFINIKYQEHTIFEVSIYDTVLVYIIILLIMIFHELGHSAASYSFKIKPKEIGFGFYIFFPVLYSNVTRIWKLDKNQRVIVNIGGVYFQGIINVFFLAFVVLNRDYNHITYLILLIIKMNLFMMAYSLFPFVRNDGYWIVSDYTNILNLNKKSYSYIFDLIKKKEKLNYYLLSYSIGQYLFILYLSYKYLPIIPKGISEFYLYLKKYGFIYLIQNDFGLLFKLIFSLIIGFFMVLTLLRFIAPLFKKDKVIKPVIVSN